MRKPRKQRATIISSYSRLRSYSKCKKRENKEDLSSLHLRGTQSHLDLSIFQQLNGKWLRKMRSPSEKGPDPANQVKMKKKEENWVFWEFYRSLNALKKFYSKSPKVRTKMAHPDSAAATVGTNEDWPSRPKRTAKNMNSIGHNRKSLLRNRGIEMIMKDWRGTWNVNENVRKSTERYVIRLRFLYPKWKILLWWSFSDNIA